MGNNFRGWGNIHDFESNLIRRLAGLLYISDHTMWQCEKKSFREI